MSGTARTCPAHSEVSESVAPEKARRCRFPGRVRWGVLRARDGCDGKPRAGWAWRSAWGESSSCNQAPAKLDRTSVGPSVLGPSVKRICTLLGKSEFRSTGAASPRIGSGTFENLTQWFPGWVRELWLTAFQAMSSTYWDSAGKAGNVSKKLSRGWTGVTQPLRNVYWKGLPGCENERNQCRMAAAD